MKWKQKATQIKHKWISGRFGDVVLVHASTALLFWEMHVIPLVFSLLLCSHCHCDMICIWNAAFFWWYLFKLFLQFPCVSCIQRFCQKFADSFALQWSLPHLRPGSSFDCSPTLPELEDPVIFSQTGGKKKQKSWGSRESHKTCNPLQTKNHQKKSQKILQQKQQNSTKT